MISKVRDIITGLFTKDCDEYVNWDEYKSKVDMISTHRYQQDCRRHNVDMIPR
jgi:hypothetical protein